MRKTKLKKTGKHPAGKILKAKQTEAKRLAAIARVLKEKKLEMILVCSSLQDFGYGYALTGIKPILHHYFFLDGQKRLQKGYFVPYFLVDRLGLEGKPNVVTFDDKSIPEDMAKFLNKHQRVGILGPAPAVHFSLSKAELVFLDDELWPILNVKSTEEIGKIEKIAKILAKVLDKVEIKSGMRMDKLAEHLDREILKEADALAFPSLVESRRRLRNVLYILGFRAKILAKDLIYVNIGAEKDGLFADAGRTFILGEKKTAENYRKFDKAFRKFVKNLKPGLILTDLPSLLKKELQLVGLKNFQLKNNYLGHSIGFNIINFPFIGQGLSRGEKLLANTTLSLVIEIKVDGKVMQLQDTVLIAENGGRILTR